MQRNTYNTKEKNTRHFVNIINKETKRTTKKKQKERTNHPTNKQTNERMNESTYELTEEMTIVCLLFIYSYQRIY